MKVRAIAFALIGIILIGCHGAAPTRAAAVPERHFSVVVQHSPSSGWAARCEEGCRWKEVKMSCGGCDVRLDVAGISRVDAAQDKVGGFEFIVSRTIEGIAARSVSGVRWKSLSSKCEQGACTARIDESGVTS
jgi:hypothetical protein